MIVIIYSGSKIAYWTLSQNGKTVATCETPGINPYFIEPKSILQILNKRNILVNHAEMIKKIYIFTAGASIKEKNELLIDTLKSFFKFAKVQLENDLFAAAKASCGDQPGLVFVLGSGSNAGYFNGKKMLPNNFGLGYVLADEGSANYLGRMLLKSYLTKKLPADLHHNFEKQYHLDRAQIFERVYRKAQPSLFLSSFIDFYTTYRRHPFIEKMLQDAFKKYIETYVLPLKAAYPGLPIHFVGSTADLFKTEISSVAQKLNVEVNSFIKEPIHNLLKYYTN